MATQTGLTLKINGMHCDACVRRVTAALSSLPGVQLESVKVGEANLNYDPSRVNAETIAAAVRNGGFETEELVSR